MKWILAFTLSFPQSGDDRWFAADKARHFFVAAAIQSAAYAALREQSWRPHAALWGATAATATASLGKEWVDRRQGRGFSGRDLMWDAAGAGVATGAIIVLRNR